MAQRQQYCRNQRCFRILELSSVGSDDGHTVGFRRFGQPLVIADESIEVVAQLEGRSEVQGIEAAQYGWIEEGCCLECRW